MLLAPYGDVGANAPIAADLGVCLIPVDRIRNELLEQGAGAGLDALQHGAGIFDISCGEGCAYGRLNAHLHRLVHLALAVYCGLGAIALDRAIAALHHIANWISVAAGPRSGSCAGPLGSVCPGRCSAGLGWASSLVQLPPDPPVPNRFPSLGVFYSASDRAVSTL